MLRRLLGRTRDIPGLRWVYDLAWIVYHCVWRPSTDGPWPRISWRQHRFNASIWLRFLTGRQQFGRTAFYQSCEALGLEGQRPTRDRIVAYGLASILRPEHRVLDLGCNTGFFAIEVARAVQHVDGIELNPSLVEIGRRAAAFLAVTNVTFERADVKQVRSDVRYDVVFAFAVYRWAGMTMEDFGQMLLRVLNPAGLVLLESNNLERDSQFDGDVTALCAGGFALVRSVTTNFDCPRRLVVLRAEA